MKDYPYKTPISMPRGSHFGSDYWITYSKKVQREIHLYSMLEYANFLVLEMNPKVEYFCEQPLKITDPSSESKRHSIFDFWVYFIDGNSKFQEVKYSTELQGEDSSALRSQKQIKFQQDWCKKHNYLYEVITEKNLYRSEYFITNLARLYSFVLRQTAQFNPDTEKELCNFLSNNSHSIAEIEAEKICNKTEEMFYLAQLYYKGIIHIDVLRRPLDKKTEVQLCVNENIIY